MNKQFEEIKTNFEISIENLREYYMTTLIENEYAKKYLDKIKNQENNIQSEYIRDNKFVFGERYDNDPAFYTSVDIDNCVKLINKLEKRKKINIRMFTINLVSIYEELLKELLTFYLRQFPKYIQNNKKKITYKEIFNFNSIKKIEKDLIKKEVMNFTYQSFRKQVKRIAKLYDVNFNFGTEIDVVDSLFLRRNLIVHNRGIVNNTFLNRLAKRLRKIYDLNQELEFNEVRFSEDIHLVRLTGKRIINDINRKYKYLESGL